MLDADQVGSPLEPEFTDTVLDVEGDEEDMDFSEVQKINGVVLSCCVGGRRGWRYERPNVKEAEDYVKVRKRECQ